MRLPLRERGLRASMHHARPALQDQITTHPSPAVRPVHLRMHLRVRVRVRVRLITVHPPSLPAMPMLLLPATAATAAAGGSRPARAASGLRVSDTRAPSPCCFGNAV